MLRSSGSVGAAGGQVFPSSAFGSLPAAGTAGRVYFVTNVGPKGSFWYDDGTRWKPVNNRLLLFSLDTSTAPLTNTETIAGQIQLPAGLLKPTDRLEFWDSGTKSGAVDSGTIRLRIGTAGTTADPAVITPTTFATANRTLGHIWAMRVESATTILPLARSDFGYGGATSGTVTAAVTIANVSNALFVTVTGQSGGVSDTIIIQDAVVWLNATAN